MVLPGPTRMGFVSSTGPLDSATRLMFSLRRDPSGSRVAGVCSGLAGRTGIDVNLIRICFVVLALSGGVGVALYACLWAFVPRLGSNDLAIAKHWPRAAQLEQRDLTIITILTCVAVWLLLGSWTPFGITPVIVGVALFLVARRQRGRRDAQPAAPSEQIDAPAGGAQQPSGPFAQASAAWQQRLAEVSHPESPLPASPAPTPPAPADARTAPMTLGPIGRTGGLPPEERPLRTAPTFPAPAFSGPSGSTGPFPSTAASTTRTHPWFTGFSVLLVSAGLAWGTFAWSSADPRPRATLALAAALGVIALGLIVAGITGRRVRLLGLAGVLVCVWVAGLQIGMVNPATGSWHDVQSGIGSASDPYRLVSTKTTIDLATQSIADGVHIDARASQVDIVAPKDRAVELHYTLRMSELDLPGTELNGNGASTVTVAAQTPGGQTDPLVVTLSATMSKVVVTRA